MIKASFYDLLPPNLHDAESRALSYAFDRQFEKLNEYIPITMFFADVMSTEEWVCDYLALMLNIKVYDVSLPLDTKRRLIQTARKNSSKKGTAKAVSDVIGTIHGGASFIPWFSYNGSPYFFKISVDTSNRGMDEEAYDKLEDAVDEYKALRSQLEAITVKSQSAGRQFHGGSVVSSESAKIVPNIPDVKCDIRSKSMHASISGEIAIIYPNINSVVKSPIRAASIGVCVSGEHAIIKMMRTED